MTSYWAAHVQLPVGVASDVRFAVEGGEFTSVTANVSAERGDERLVGVVLPGLANAHSHAFHRALRGRTHGGGGTFWTWREQMYAVARHLDPDSYLALARALYAEMALAGFTVVGEFHYLHHAPGGARYNDPNAMGHALIQAAEEAGVRLTLLDTCYLAGGLNGDGHQQLDAGQQRFSDGDVDAWASRVELLQSTPMARIGAAAHSVRAMPLAGLTRLAEVRTAGPVHIHLSEQPAENTASMSFYGCSPTQLLDRAGLLGEQTTAVHATHVSKLDIGLLGGSRTTACFCPTTERDLADGIGPARQLLDAGSPLSLGSDQQAVVDPFEEVRGLEMDERLASNQRGRFSPSELLDAASRAGYACLGWPEGGQIAVGSVADFVVVRNDSVRTAGSAPDQIAFSATGADIDRVVVGGTTVVRDGEHRLGPVGEMLSSALSSIGEAGW